jgi:hypothetical protein
MSQKNFQRRKENTKSSACDEEEPINHLHRNLGVETLPQLVSDRFGSGPSRPTGKNACFFLDLAHRN